MTTDELFAKLPSHIGNHEVGNCYVLADPEDDVQWLYLHNDGKHWCASYGIEGEFLCLGQMENGMYDNAFAYGDTPNEALQGLYDWCLRHGFIKDK